MSESRICCCTYDPPGLRCMRCVSGDHAHCTDFGLTSVNERYVFVRYGSDKGSKATSPKDLTFLAGTGGSDE